MFLSAIKRSGLHYQGYHDILYLWGGLLKKSGVFVNNMRLPELQVPPGSALSLCSVRAAFDRNEPCIFSHVAYITETFASDPHTQWHRALAARDESDQLGPTFSLSKFQACLNWLQHQGSKKQRKAVKSADFRGIPNQWEFSILLMRHVFHQSLKSSVIIFLRLKKVTEETSGDSNTSSIFLKVLICIMLPTCLILKNASTEQMPFTLTRECPWKWVSAHIQNWKK